MFFTKNGWELLSEGQEVLFGTQVGAYRRGKNCYTTRFVVAQVVSDSPQETIIKDDTGASIILTPAPYSSAKVAKSGDRIIWSVPLPKGSADEIRNFCQVAIESMYNLGMFHVSRIENGRVFGRPVVLSKRNKDDLAEEGSDGLNEEAIAFRELGSIMVAEEEYEIDLLSRGRPVVLRMDAYEPSTDEVVVGTLIAARDFSARLAENSEDQTIIWEAIDWETVGHFESLSAVSDFMPDLDEAHSKNFMISLGGVSRLEYERALAIASAEPEKAMVLAYPPDGSSVSIIGHTGRTFFVWEDAADSLYGQAPGPGLYVLGDISPWSYKSYEGEYDAGIDASWVPATIKDIEEWGFTLKDFDHELYEGYLDGEESEDGLTMRMIESAAQSCRSEALENDVQPEDNPQGAKP